MSKAGKGESIIRDILRCATVLIVALMFYNYEMEEINQKKRETIAAVVMADKDPIKVVCAVDGENLAHHQMCIESAKQGLVEGR